ncbi:hypothetical protein I316_02454 [Kwoniella heveanensis BCC8398]|uniref:LCCL domain-containing protein n=1 Tax=Kwoniella heveanensis BCC8398 TaxID=1296120 RepID=A0A1B9GY68_9TREE|nr:hypothetical protein I316_02454 [Kwoniella heveanensis BCC8398]
MDFFSGLVHPAASPSNRSLAVPAGLDRLLHHLAPWDDWPPDNCGLGGGNCQADLERIDGRTFRCLGGCRDTTLGNKRWVGYEKVDGQALIIGGGDENGTYRADSWLCASAIHSNLISSTLGGCVNFHSLPYPDGASNFMSSFSAGLNSTGFAPNFPGAFRLTSHSITGCLDLHFIVTGFNAFCLLMTTLFLRPPSSLLFIILLVGGYFHLILFADPPDIPPDWENIIAGLPAVLLAGYWMWKLAFKRTLEGFMTSDLPFEVALWQGLGFWLGVESRTVFARLPISRLGYDALDPAGVITLVIIIMIVVIVVLVQAWSMRKYGLLRYYIIRYIGLIPLIIVLAVIPGFTLRPHHYLLALIAIPVLSLPNRISLFGQAFALGLFLDGVGRWGWDGLIQVTSSLLGDADAGTLVPEFWKNATTSSKLWWDPINSVDGVFNVTGFSVLVDDMQRFSNFTNSTLDMATLNLTQGIDHYIRLAFVANGTSLDFTDPLTCFSNGSFSFPKTG